MELEIFLELVATLPEDKKEEVMEEEYRRQRAMTDALCEMRREHK